ncbi:MAG: STAS domain-containing protein [Pirellulales bacterium]|jgi:anti-anti-sigma factor|nr:STAS domain-containing protein [Thermoguttaceae bacterium]MDD4789088.1 STAS domain-containing protein [Pirellulales bacterium]MDI9443832.1 STAS domain-containing protein [Planctomycetota bacterium]NLY99606.1 STAS domain-containing protein [Pirellulaceae bacterium]
MTSVSHQNGITIVELESRYDSLDDASLGQLSQVLLEAASGPQRPRLLLDFSATRFIGSTFIGLMVRVWKRIRDRDGQMGICCLAPFCQETLVIARLYDTLWTPYATREEALAAMRRA